jgi:hypothetical protein
MVEINTIKEFYSLTSEQRGDICRNLNTVTRLKGYLETLNEPITPKPAEWVPCKKCESRGWVVDSYEERNNADIHASTIHKCLKYIWFSCSGYASQKASKVTPESRLIFDHGHALHHMLQTYGRKGAWGPPIYYQPEVAILPNAEEAQAKKAHVLEEAIKYRIRSSVDAVIWKYHVSNVRDLGDVYIRIGHEYKSIGPGRPKKDGTLFGGYADLKGPKVEHKQQGSIYQHCLNLPIMVYIYYNKGNDQIVDFPVPYEALTWNYVRGRIDKVLSYVDKEEAPPWEFTSSFLDATECKTCDYLHICDPPNKFVIK